MAELEKVYKHQRDLKRKLYLAQFIASFAFLVAYLLGSIRVTANENAPEWLSVALVICFLGFLLINLLYAIWVQTFNRWSRFTLDEIVGQSGIVKIVAKGFPCDKNEVDGMVTFADGYGDVLANWFQKKWKETGGSPSSFYSANPIFDNVESVGYPTMKIKIELSEPADQSQVYGDTVDAILEGINNRHIAGDTDALCWE